MPKMDKQYQLILGTFIDNKFVWHDVDSYDDIEVAYREFKKYVNSQLKYSDEELLKVWNTAPVQKQVGRVAEAGKTAALALPSALWDGAVKVTKAATKNGTPGQKLDAAIKAGKDAQSDVVRGAEQTAEAVEKAADKAVADAKAGAAKKTTPAKNGLVR